MKPGALHHKTPFWIGVLAWILTCILMPYLAEVLSGIMDIIESRSWPESIDFNNFLTFEQKLAAFLMAMTCLPTLVLVWLARILNMPRGLADVLGGALVGIGLYLLAFWRADLSWYNVSFIAAAGMVGALTYWLTTRTLAAWWLKHHEESWLWGRRIS